MEVTITREIRGYKVSVKGEEHETDEILKALIKAGDAIKMVSNEELAAQHS